MHRLLRLGAILATLALLETHSRVNAQSPPFTITIGVSADQDMVPLLYAQRTGLFTKAGLNVQIDPSGANGAAVAAAVSSGSFDVGKGSVTSIFDAHLRGIPFVIVGTATVYKIKSPNGALLVARDSPIHSVVDLTQGTIGLAGLHDIGQLAASKAVDDAGGNWKALQFVEISKAAALVAVTSHRVIAAEAANPLYFAAVDSGDARALTVYDSLGDGWPLSVYFTTQDYATKHADAIKTFARVLAESAHYTNTHSADLIPMISSYTGIAASTLQRMPPQTNGTGVNVTGLQVLIDAEVKYGMLPRGFSARDIIDQAVERG